MTDHPGGALSDTSVDAARAYTGLVGRMTPIERLERMLDLSRAAHLLALGGLRRRFPAASQRELLLRLAVLRLGPDLVQRAYGWRAPADGA